MGYQSDVVLAVAVQTRHVDTLIAAYMVQPGTQTHDCLAAFSRKDLPEDNITLIWASFTSVKWYESYDDVQAFERIVSLCDDLAQEETGDFVASTLKLRIGENDNDVERSGSEVFGAWRNYTEVDDVLCKLSDTLYEFFSIRRELIVDVEGTPIQESAQ